MIEKSHLKRLNENILKRWFLRKREVVGFQKRANSAPEYKFHSTDFRFFWSKVDIDLSKISDVPGTVPKSTVTDTKSPIPYILMTKMLIVVGSPVSFIRLKSFSATWHWRSVQQICWKTENGSSPFWKASNLTLNIDHDWWMRQRNWRPQNSYATVWQNMNLQLRNFLEKIFLVLEERSTSRRMILLSRIVELKFHLRWVLKLKMRIRISQMKQQKWKNRIEDLLELTSHLQLSKVHKLRTLLQQEYRL